MTMQTLRDIGTMITHVVGGLFVLVFVEPFVWLGDKIKSWR
jgi:hypothetical protein